MIESTGQGIRMKQAEYMKRLFVAAESIVFLSFIISLLLFFSYWRSFRPSSESDFIRLQQRITLLTNAHHSLIEGDTLRTDSSSALFKRETSFLLDDWKRYRELAAAEQSEGKEIRKETGRQNLERADSLIRRVSVLPRNIIQIPSSVLKFRIREENDALLLSEMMRLQQMRDEESSAGERWIFLSIVLAAIVYGSALLLAVLYRKQRKKKDEELDSLLFSLESTLNPIQIIRSDGTTRYANPAFYKWSGLNPDTGENDSFMRTIDGGDGAQDTSIWETVKQALHQEESWSGKVLHKRSDGRMAEADILIVPFTGRSERKLEYIVFYTDATEKREYAQKLEQTQKLYKEIVEGSLDGLMVVQNNVLVYTNPRALNIFGYKSGEDVQHVSFADLFQLDGYEKITIDKIVSESAQFDNGEFRCRTKSANIIDIEAHTLSIAWEGMPAVLISFRDVTERKMLEREQALYVWEQEKLSEIDKQLVGVVDLQKILDAIIHQTMKLTKSGFTGILFYDSESANCYWKAYEGNVHDFPVDWNEAPPALKIFEQRNEMTILKRDEEKEEFSLSSIPELSRENIAAAVILPLRVEKELRGFLIVGYPLQYNYSEKEVRMLNSLAEKSSIAMVNAKLYNDLLEHEKELELLSAARVQVQEEERRRIAREIHDGLGQLLTAIKFNLEILEDSLLTTPDEKNRIDDMKKLLDDVMKEARELSYNLMPSVLEDFGLIPAVQLLCEQFSRQTGIQVQFLPHGGDDRFGADLEISIYRIVQEALTNIQKHASATSVELQIIASANSVRMTVEDNGKGFAAQKIIRRQRDRNGIGLASMRERTSLLGGTFTIESVLQHGTLLCVEIPIKKKESKP